MSTLIPARTLSGFRDYSPDVMLARERVLEAARRVYRSYGFTPIDTPACEALDVLLGKGGDESDKLVYRVLSARGEKAEMGLRFDLTVPFARFTAKNINDLGTPFKRYAMGPVWRGERPGQGRFREFWQCDFDTIGTTSNAADIETALVINDLFTAIGIEKFEVRINNRLILNAILTAYGVPTLAVPILRALDKLPKIGREAVREEMLANQTPPGAADALLGLVVGSQGMKNAEILDELPKLFDATGLSMEPSERDSLVAGRRLAEEGVQKLRELLAVAATAGVPDGRIRIDLSICRGLDYYTGTIYETFLLGDYTDPDEKDPAAAVKPLEGFGSVCSGGRYDNLASLFTKQVLPGVGASLGLDRLIAAMEKMGHPLLAGGSTPADVLVVQFDATRLGDYQRVARQLRAAGIGAEVYPDAKKVGVQLAYAEKRGFRLALIAGSDEFAKGVWKVKYLAKREETTVPEDELVARIRPQG